MKTHPFLAPILGLFFLASKMPDAPTNPNAGIRPYLVREAIGVKVPLRMKIRYYFHRFGAWKGLAFAALAVLAAPFGFAVIPGVAVGLAYPANSIYAGGNPRELCAVNLQVKTVTSVRSGSFVITDTDDNHFKIAGAAALNVIGVVSDINWTNPAWVKTGVPVTEDILTVYLLQHGARVRFMSGAALAMGDIVSTDATGQAAAAGVVNTAVGRALETRSGASTAVLTLGVI